MRLRSIAEPIRSTRHICIATSIRATLPLATNPSIWTALLSISRGIAPRRPTGLVSFCTAPFSKAFLIAIADFPIRTTDMYSLVIALLRPARVRESTRTAFTSWHAYIPLQTRSRTFLATNLRLGIIANTPALLMSRRTTSPSHTSIPNGTGCRPRSTTNLGRRVMAISRSALLEAAVAAHAIGSAGLAC